MLKKFVINIIILIALFFVSDIILFYFDQYKHNLDAEIPVNYRYSIFPKKYGLKNLINTKFREPINEKSKKAPIYIFGCSYGYGYNLNNEETFGANLAQITNRPVYNFSYISWGIQHFLGLIDNYDFSHIKKPDYIIYVYIDDHLRRILTRYCSQFDSTVNFRYKVTDDNFYVDEDVFISPYIYKTYYINKYIEKVKTEKNTSELFFKYVKKINLIIKKKFPNAKFIIFVYEERDNELVDWYKIEKLGVTVVKNDINIKHNKHYGHPTAEEWKMCTPLFVKKAGIK